MVVERKQALGDEREIVSTPAKEVKLWDRVYCEETSEWVEVVNITYFPMSDSYSLRFRYRDTKERVFNFPSEEVLEVRLKIVLEPYKLKSSSKKEEKSLESSEERAKSLLLQAVELVDTDSAVGDMMLTLITEMLDSSGWGKEG